LAFISASSFFNITTCCSAWSCVGTASVQNYVRLLLLLLLVFF
jgi:hypothetical protein